MYCPQVIKCTGPRACDVKDWTIFRDFKVGENEFRGSMIRLSTGHVSCDYSLKGATRDVGGGIYKAPLKLDAIDLQYWTPGEAPGYYNCRDGKNANLCPIKLK